MQLLFDWLTPEQARDFEDKHCFLVTGSRGGHYQINGNQHSITVAPFNITRLDPTKDMLATDLCIVPVTIGRPAGDILLMQKMALETEEDVVLKKCNWRQAMSYRAPTWHEYQAGSAPR